MEINKKYIISENFKTKIYLNESFWENTLLVAGFIPVIGEVADIILIIKFLKEKRFIEAGLMMIALIPTFGDFIVKPFLKIGKASGAFSSATKFANFLKTDAKASEMYSKVGKGFKNPLVDKMISQVNKVLPNSAKDMEIAKNLHINMWGKIIEKESKSGLGTWAKQATRRKAMEKYLIKTGGKTPSNFLSGWWNVVYKARRNRKELVRKTILGSNILASLGIFNIQDLERKISNDSDAEKLLQDPKFKEFYDKMNQEQTIQNSQTTQQTVNPEENNPQRSGGDFLSSILGSSNGTLGLSTLKSIASIIT